MARKLRGQYPGAIYPVVNRGDRRGWFLGDKTLNEESLAQVSVSAQAGSWHYGEEFQESAEAKAERLVAGELKRRKWDAGRLVEERKAIR
jgi:hypothetical protein